MKQRFLIIISFTLLLVYLIYLCMPSKYIVYALIPTSNGGRCEWKEVYWSYSSKKALEKYRYLNQHKENGVKGYIFLNEETGNSIIPF